MKKSSAKGSVYLVGLYTPHPWTEFLAHACENITFPQVLLQAVTRLEYGHVGRTMWLFSVRLMSILYAPQSRMELGPETIVCHPWNNGTKLPEPEKLIDAIRHVIDCRILPPKTNGAGFKQKWLNNSHGNK